MPADETYDEMVRRMEKFDEPPEGSSASDKKSDADETHDTPGLMFAYARRSAEKVFGKDSIYT